MMHTSRVCIAKCVCCRVRGCLRGRVLGRVRGNVRGRVHGHVLGRVCSRGCVRVAVSVAVFVAVAVDVSVAVFKVVLFFILCGASESQKSKMAAHKPEILISQHVYNIAEKFQRQHPCFQD